jgi:hypothetical protein
MTWVGLKVGVTALTLRAAGKVYHGPVGLHLQKATLPARYTGVNAKLHTPSAWREIFKPKPFDSFLAAKIQKVKNFFHFFLLSTLTAGRTAASGGG